MTAPRYDSSLATPRREIAARERRTRRPSDARKHRGSSTRLRRHRERETTVGWTMSFLLLRGLSVTACAQSLRDRAVVCPVRCRVCDQGCIPARCSCSAGPWLISTHWRTMVFFRQKIAFHSTTRARVTPALRGDHRSREPQGPVMHLTRDANLLDPDSSIRDRGVWTLPGPGGRSVEEHRSHLRNPPAMAIFLPTADGGHPPRPHPLDARSIRPGLGPTRGASVAPRHTAVLADLAGDETGQDVRIEGIPLRRTSLITVRRADRLVHGATPSRTLDRKSAVLIRPSETAIPLGSSRRHTQSPRACDGGSVRLWSVRSAQRPPD